jgi:NAD(P)-dependent dehydrogenase (short-subunit alcohol dehydrogenase family)
MANEMGQPNAGASPDDVWLITGCSSGFGQSLASSLAAKGQTVAATARQVEALDYLGAETDWLAKLALDVTRPEQVEAAIAEARARFGRIDVVVNNAGIGVIGPVEDVSDAQTRHQFEVNVFGVFNVTRAVQPIFRDQRRGLFINFASMAGEQSVPSLGVYSASKFAVEGLSEAVRQEMEPYGIGVMIVEPGPFDTEWIGKNAVWAVQTDRYPGVWDYVTNMKAVYADRKVVGDPIRAAQAILAAAAMDPPPFRLPLHAFSVEATRAKLKLVAADLDRMEPISRAVQYDS